MLRGVRQSESECVESIREMSVAMCYLSSTAAVAQPWDWVDECANNVDLDDNGKDLHRDAPNDDRSF